MALRTPEADVKLRDSADTRGTSAQVGADATWGPEVVLPGARFAADATYLQQGDDLVLIGTDGSTFVVRGYFLLDNPPDLVTPEGARMTPALVDSFTPPEATGQYAQVGQIAQAADPIGQVKDITGKAFAVRTDGTRAQLSAGDSVYQGDVVETADGAAINMVFVDQTTFALGGDARLALDELVYNPATQTGSSSFSIMKGVFVFVSGEIAKADNTKMQVNTPVATIGIRGTKVAGEIKPAGEESKFTVIDGEIAVATQAGSVIMGDQNATTTVTSFSAAPTAPVVISQTEVNQSYSGVRSVSGGILNGGSRNETSPETQAPQQPGEQNPDGPQGPEQEAAAEGEAGSEEAAGEGGSEGEGEGAAGAEGTAEAEGAGAEGEAGEREQVGPRGPGDGEPEGERPDGRRDGEQLAEGEGPGDPNGPAGEAEAEGAGGEGPGEDVQLPGGRNGDETFGEAGPPDDAGPDGPGPDGNVGPGPADNGGFAQGGPGFGGGPLGGFGDGLAGIGGGFGDNFGGPGGLGGPGDPFGPGGLFGGFDDFLAGGPFDGLPPPPDDSIDIIFDEEAPVLDAPVFDDRSTLSTNEVILGGNNADTLIGGTGNDDIFGFPGDDDLSGGAGNDTLVGGDGDDIVNGGAGDDFLVAGSGFGFDTYDGGAGTDTLSFSSTFLGITVDLGTGTASGSEIDTDTITNIEVLIGGDGDDFLDGDAGINEIFGGAGNDIIDGSGGTDIIDGGSGDDIIGFDTSVETINGGAGTDAIVLFGAGQTADVANLVAVGSIEEIDLSGVGSNTLAVTSALITTMSGNGTLSAFGNGDDVVTSADSWNLTGPVSIGGVTLDRFSDGGSTINSSVSEFRSTGTITFDAGAALTNNIVNQGTLLTADGIYTNEGLITLTAGGDIDMAGAKTLAGNGTFLNQQSLSLLDDTVAGTLDSSLGTIGLEGNITVDGVLILGSNVDGAALVEISGTGTLLNQGDHIIEDSATLSVDTIENQGLFAFDTLTSLISSATINNTAGGTLGFLTNTNIDPGGALSFSNDGLVTLAGSTTLSLQDASISNTGTLNIDGDFVLTNSTVSQDGILQMASGGFIKLQGGSVFNLNNDFTLTTGRNFVIGDGGTTGELGGTGTFTNAAVVALNNGTLSGNMASGTGLFSISGSANLNSGVMDFNADNTLIFSGGADKLANSGTIRINNGSVLTVDTGTLENLAGATIDGFGAGSTIVTSSGGLFADNGITTFGQSPGSMTIVGNTIRGDSAFVEFELGGLAPGIGGFDQFTVTGGLDAGGTIDVVEFGGFEVSAGDSFAIINAGTLTSSFREISGLDVGGGVVLDATQSANGVVLTGRAVTHQGTASDDVLTGGAGDDVIVGGDGADFIVSGGGADLMHGGDGDDIFIAADTGFGRLDGEGGFDTVRFDGGGFDLTVLRGDQLSGIERFDITGSGDNTLTLGTEIALAATSGTNALTNVTDSLLIDGNAGDVVNAQGAWSNTGTVTIDGNGYSVFESGTNGAQIFVDTDVSVNLV